MAPHATASSPTPSPTAPAHASLAPAADTKAPAGAPVVLVVGADEAGISLVEGELGVLGLTPPPADDRRPGDESTSTRRFESISLTKLSDEILHQLGGSPDDPPPVPELRTDAPSPAELVAPVRRAVSSFDAVFGLANRPVCWADRRTALLVPFWRHVLSGRRRIAAILCVSDPLRAALSLEQATGVALPVGLALWERYNRRAIEGLSGLPVFVSVASDVVAEPEDWRQAVVSWLQALDVSIPGGAGVELCAPPSVEKSAEGEGSTESLSGGRRVGGAAEADDEAVLPSQQRLYRELAALRGPNASFAYTPDFPESVWSINVLEQRRDQERFWKAADWLAKELVTHLPEKPPARPRTFDYPPNATTDLPRYHRFLRDRGEAIRLPVAPPTSRPRRGHRALGHGATPMFSVIVPTYRTPLKMLERCVSSVLSQDFVDFELCICDDDSREPGLLARLAEYAAADGRIKLTKRTVHGGTAAAANDALALAGGRYVAYLDHDAAFHRSTLQRLADTIRNQPAADLLYTDEDRADETGMRHGPRFKPGWSPDLLLSGPYLSHVLVVRRQLLEDVKGLRAGYDGAEYYDLMLRVTERTDAIVHVPEVLYHALGCVGSPSREPDPLGTAADAGRRSLEDAIARRGVAATVTSHPTVPGGYHVRRHPPSRPLVSAIVPFRDEPALTAACYRSFVERPGYDNFELLLVDNDSALPETQALLDEITGDHRVRVIDSPGSFDWVAINNAAAEQARGDVLLFMNNDVEALSTGWLAAMVGHVTRPEVGAVGARLLYPDLTVQHAGVAVGLGWGATHLQQGLPADEPGYLALAVVTRDCSAVTGACLMARRDLFEEVGGFDSDLPIAFNDIDFCLRLRAKGYLVVYTPLAELVHHESKSIGHTELVEAPFFRRRWRSLMLSGDPYYNSNLGRFDNSCRLPTEEDEAKWTTFLSMLDESSTS